MPKIVSVKVLDITYGYNLLNTQRPCLVFDKTKNYKYGTDQTQPNTLIQCAMTLFLI